MSDDRVRIGVVGGLNMDIRLFGVEEPGVGATYLADHYLIEPGGKGANQARAAARLGADVVLVGRVGDDEFGHLCVAAVEADGVDVGGVAVTAGERTGFVVIRLVEGHHVSLVFSPGANNHLVWSDVEAALPRLADRDVLLTQGEVPADVVDRLLTWASGRGIPVYLDPAAPDQLALSALQLAEIITPDREEAAALTGRTLSTPAAPWLAARELVDLGVERAVVKLGAAGALLVDTTSGTRHVPTASVRPVDETGAGDVFIAALAVRRASGAGWPEAVRFANAAAARSVSERGLALPTLPEVLELEATIPGAA